MSARRREFPRRPQIARPYGLLLAARQPSEWAGLTPGAPARTCCGLRAYDLPPDPCAPTRHYGRGVSGGYRDDHDACAQNERPGRPGPLTGTGPAVLT